MVAAMVSAPIVAAAQPSLPDERARVTEQQMTDDERFAMIISVLGATGGVTKERDKRIPEDVAMSAGYMPGVPRLGVPALRSSDANMGITNPGYRPDDPGATAFSYAKGEFPKERLAEMVRRILRSVYAVGIDKWRATPAVDMAKHNEIALAAARQGIVLLKNDRGVLPLATDKPLKIAVIGGYAQVGVPTGTGSGAVLPVGGYADIAF